MKYGDMLCENERKDNMLSQIETDYQKKIWKLNFQQWCNYFSESRYNLDIIDSEIYLIAKNHSVESVVLDKRIKSIKLLGDTFLVDKHPDVSRLRNKIDNLDNYIQLLPNENEFDQYQVKIAISDLMKDDVIKLMEMRNKYSMKLGYSSYVDLIMNYNGLCKGEIVHLLRNFLNDNIDFMRKFIYVNEISYETWSIGLDKYSYVSQNYNVKELIEATYELFDYNENLDKIDIEFDDSQIGYATEFSNEKVKLRVGELKSLNSIRTLFHELGHALFYSFIQEDGVYRILPPSLDETFAVVMEYILSSILLSEKDSKKVLELMKLDYVRCAVSSLYEFSIWDDPREAEQLFNEYYSRIGLSVKNPVIWAYDSFRSIDSVYIHNYVIGIVIAEKLYHYLSEQYSRNYREWFEWIVKNVYQIGNKESIREKVNFLPIFT